MNPRAATALLSAALVAGCNPGASIDGKAKHFNSPDAVVAGSTMPFLPRSARSVRYYSEKYLDEYEYLYFEDSRASTDEFARALVGVVPVGADPSFIWVSDAGVKWWPARPPAAGRSKAQHSDNHGDRRILIIDYPDHSAAWVFAAGHH